MGSTNGTYLGQQRVQRVEISGRCEIRLGHPGSGPAVSCSIAAAPGVSGPAVTSAALVAVPQPFSESGRERTPSSVMRLPTRVLRIGRAEDNDVVVSDLSVSRYHAQLSRTGQGTFRIVDLGSFNGTFVSGQRVLTAPVTQSDVVGIGSATFRLDGDELQEFIDTGDISLDARGLTVRLPGGKVILDDVSFPLGERCLLGVIGPSGAGKSTLLGALTGMRPATSGSVLYDGRDLYANYAELRHRIGLVPQENILHTQLSARRALGYAAELRFPRDTSAAERARRISEVIGELSLTQHAGTRASALSGGQQKRVNVALELLTKPSLLFLDEPTSGLDPGLDLSVMEMMSGLARDGRTVIVVTHSVANLDICDRLLVLVPGGKVAYFGPPAGGLRHFAQPGWAQVFRVFEAGPDRDWAAEFRGSPHFAQYVMTAAQAGQPDAAQVRRAPPPPRPQNRLAQMSTLVRRYLAVIASDRNYVGVIALLPVILGGLIWAVPAPRGLTGTNNADAQSVLLVLMLGACLAGVANAVRELVKERPIFVRERAAGLSAGAYLWSKLVVLGVISAVQAVVLVVIGMAGRPLPPHGAFLRSLPLVELILAVAALAVASMMIGLEQFWWISPSRWGFGATASTSSLNQISPPVPGTKPDPLWNHSPHIWLLEMAMQVALMAVFIALTWRRLGGVGPSRSRRR